MSTGMARWFGHGAGRRHQAGTAGSSAEVLLLGTPFLYRCDWNSACYLRRLVFSISNLSKGLVAYAHKWRGNDGLFALFNGGFSFVLHDTVDWINSGTTVRNLITILIGRDHGALVTIEHVSFAASKLLAIGAVGSAILWATLYARDISSCWLIFMGCLLLTSPIVHPWYLLWVAPFASLYASNLNPWFSRGLITWCLLIWIAYLPRPKYLVTGVWEEQPILRLVQYFPVWTCIFFRAIRGPQAKNITR